MSQRKSPRNRTQVVGASAAVLILIIVGIYWFVIRDTGSDNHSKTAPEAAQTFTAPGNSFTFKYPGGFVQKSGLDARGYVWIAGVGPYDLLNVKRLDNKPTAPDRLVKSVTKTLTAETGTQILSQGTDKRGGIDMVTFKVQSMVNGLPLRSSLIYFTANAVTWQLECESQSQAPTIDAACAQALSTFVAITPQHG